MSPLVEDAASALLRAYETRVPLRPLTETHPELGLDDAYAIQLAQVDGRLAEGRSVRGHKVGLTSAAMRRQLGVDQPDYGHLLDDMFYPEFAPIPTERFLQPRIEPEIAFVLRDELAGPGVTAADAARAVDFILPALELIDSRIADWKIALYDTIADNASSGGVVLGSHPTRLGAVELRLAGCILTRDGEIVETGAGGAVLGDPLIALAWLANTLGERGMTLEAGHVVLPGACTTSVAVAPGDVFVATFDGLGTVTARFA
jgi:2-keto-4-pentenoate hydratase